jgi:hypothetical protein
MCFLSTFFPFYNTEKELQEEWPDSFPPPASLNAFVQSEVVTSPDRRTAQIGRDETEKGTAEHRLNDLTLKKYKHE